ncbi:MAG TPA: replicative DNA helicase [Alphaproteobacteria bacterium]|nr:replicative DNA helicase [Alphaproteobacteria bacterium]
MSASPVSPRPGPQGQPPPHNLDAEQALLAALIQRNSAFEDVREVVKPEDFYNGVFARIFQAVGKTIDAGLRADSITLRALFASDQEFMQLGGADYLANLAGCYVSLVNAPSYAQSIAEAAARRKLLAAAEEIRRIALEVEAPPGGAEALLSEAEETIYKLTERSRRIGAAAMPVIFQEALAKIDAAIQNGGKPAGISTGLQALDKKLGSLEPGLLYVLAARPSMGKTALGVTIAANAAKAGHSTLFHSFEMPREAIAMRIVARLTGIPANEQKRLANVQQYDQIIEKMEEAKGWALAVDSDEALTITQVRSRAIRHKRRHGLKLLVLDYLSLMRPVQRMQNRNYEIEEITRGLKGLAKELGIPILLLAQLNRETEKRDDKRPTLSDLRDSGAVEQDADVVMFIYRAEHYLTKNPPRRRDNETVEHFNIRYQNWEADVEASRGKGEIIIAKNRDGETGFCTLLFEGWKCLYRDLEEEASA